LDPVGFFVESGGAQVLDRLPQMTNSLFLTFGRLVHRTPILRSAVTSSFAHSLGRPRAQLAL
jgi:hypothetical protein